MLVIEGFYGRQIVIPEDRFYYPRKGLWLRPDEEGTLVIGVSQATVVLVSGFTYLEYVVEEGQELETDDHVAFAETYKAMQNIETPLPGTVLRLNRAVEGENAFLMDEHYYDEGWLFALRPREELKLEEIFSDAKACQESLLRYEFCGKAPPK